jgi:hypothetical protein
LHTVRMRYFRELAFVALCSMAASASAQDIAPGAACPLTMLESPVQYSRPHQIPTAAAPDDITHKMVTPGGMILDAPKMVAATDVLTLLAQEPKAVCFKLRTFARDRHTCELGGLARKEEGTTYLFSDDTAVLRLTLIAEDQVRVEPVGTGYRNRCEPSGKIEAAIYTLSKQSDPPPEAKE